MTPYVSICVPSEYDAVRLYLLPFRIWRRTSLFASLRNMTPNVSIWAKFPARSLSKFYRLSKNIYVMSHFHLLTLWKGVRGSVVGWGTTLQAGRSRDRIPDEVNFFNLPNPSTHTMALGSTQPLTEMSTRNIPGGEGRPARKADNLTAICEPIVYKMWEPQHLTTLWVFTAHYRDTLLYGRERGRF
jgi:hypothetical protein